MQMRISAPFVWCAALMGLFVSCTIVKNDAANAKQVSSLDSAFAMSAGDSTFDPAKYAAEIWEPVVLPRVESLAVDYHTLVAELRSDEAGTSRKYGYVLNEERNRYNFAVKGTVKLLSIDTSSQIGTVSLDLAPFDGKADCLLIIGPVFRGSALRDIQNTFTLNDFGNQVEFARLARELNNKVSELVLKDMDLSRHIGAEAELLGVFTYDGPGSVIEITPVRLSFTGE